MFGIYPVPPYTPLEAEGLICGGFSDTYNKKLRRFTRRLCDAVRGRFDYLSRP